MTTRTDPGEPRPARPVRALVDLLHPAHVHFFRNFIEAMRARGHEVIVTSREKDVTLALLEHYGIPHRTLSAIGSSKLDLLGELVQRGRRLRRVIREERPDVLLGVMGTFVAPLGRWLGVPSVVFYGTESARLTNGLVYRCCDAYVTPEFYREERGRKHLRYPGTQELAYLAPRYFRPDPSVREELGLAEGERFTILRFVSWGASHDIGHRGLDPERKREAVRRFAAYGRVFVSSEGPLPPELEGDRLRLAPERLHHALAYATLVYGESATLAAEAACLGTHAIYLDDAGRGFTDGLEREFGLVRNFSESEADQRASLEAGVARLADPAAKEDARVRRERLLARSADLPVLMVELALRYAAGAAARPGAPLSRPGEAPRSPAPAPPRGAPGRGAG